MGKGGGGEQQLLDDSALINAFENAISNYKMMHGKGDPENSLNRVKLMSSTAQDSSAPSQESGEAKRGLESVNKISVAPNDVTYIGETINPSVKGSHSAVEHEHGSNGQNIHNSYLNTQCEEDYNCLLNQYNELEEQRKNILQQLYQVAGWTYQDSDACGQWGTFSATQEHHAPTTQTSCQTNTTMQLGATTSQEHQIHAARDSYPTAACSCCSHTCPSMSVPCTSSTGYTSSGACAGKICKATSEGAPSGKSLSVTEDDLIKTAMRAADKALSLLKTKISSGSDVSEETTKETDVGKLAQGNCTETDLTVVFHAWYSAGFYTCKYLMEQSATKK